MKYYFSFGAGQVHKSNDIDPGIEGAVLDVESLVQIEAPSFHEARDLMWFHFAAQWSMQYDEESIRFEYFPRGVILLMDTSKPKSMTWTAASV